MSNPRGQRRQRSTEHVAFVVSHGFAPPPPSFFHLPLRLYLPQFADNKVPPPSPPQLPQDTLTNIKPPAPGLDQKSRQQTVVWIAQDVYAALLNRVRGLREQLQMAVVWRDIALGMGDGVGVAKIHDLLVVELGEEGPMLLGEFEGINLGLWIGGIE